MAKVLISLFLHDKSYNTKACQLNVQPTWGTRRFFGFFLAFSFPLRQRHQAPTPKKHTLYRAAARRDGVRKRQPLGYRVQLEKI